MKKFLVRVAAFLAIFGVLSAAGTGVASAGCRTYPVLQSMVAAR